MKSYIRNFKTNLKKFKRIEVAFLSVILVAVFGFYPVFAAEKTSTDNPIEASDRNLNQPIQLIEGEANEFEPTARMVSVRSSDDLPSIVFQPEFPVSIEADGKKITVETKNTTVENLLISQGIELNDGDVVNLPLSKEVIQNDHISVSRMITTEETETSQVQSKIVYKETSLLKNGQTRTLSYGSNGSKESVYEVKSVNDTVIEKNLISENILVAPTDTVILVGKNDAPISTLDFNCSLDANGIPTSYSKVLTNQVATGYSAGPRARGASGMKLSYGYVATNPAVIPYGTKMYITSPDGSFVYGYAIAADTGIGLLQGIIDVDLYYETYLESCLNGRRNVNIYILN